MFIEVKKIVTENERTDRNETVRNPSDGGAVKSGEKVVSEIIRADKIKSAREWHTRDESKKKRTLLYMYPDNQDSNSQNNHGKIHIEEDYKDFGSRLGAVMLNG